MEFASPPSYWSKAFAPTTALKAKHFSATAPPHAQERNKVCGMCHKQHQTGSHLFMAFDQAFCSENCRQCWMRRAAAGGSRR